MKRPTWATVVGVLAIIFGIFGVFGGAQEMVLPSMLEMQKEMMESLSQGKTPDGETAPKITMEVETEEKIQKIEMAQMFKTMGQQFKFPEWYKTWAIVIGLVSMVISALYLLSGVFLHMKKQFAIDESPRVCRRLIFLRGLANEQTTWILPRSPRTSRTLAVDQRA